MIPWPVNSPQVYIKYFIGIQIMYFYCFTTTVMMLPMSMPNWERDGLWTWSPFQCYVSVTLTWPVIHDTTVPDMCSIKQPGNPYHLFGEVEPNFCHLNISKLFKRYIIRYSSDLLLIISSLGWYTCILTGFFVVMTLDYITHIRFCINWFIDIKNGNTDVKFTITMDLEI